MGFQVWKKGRPSFERLMLCYAMLYYAIVTCAAILHFIFYILLLPCLSRRNILMGLRSVWNQKCSLHRCCDAELSRACLYPPRESIYL